MLIEDNTEEFKAAMAMALLRALEIIGGTAETAAKELCPPKWGPELRNSITHQVADGELQIGSPLEIAAYAELGTGRHYQPPPQWLENQVQRGTKIDAAGLDHWIYFDVLENTFKIGAPQEASPYLRPAIEDNIGLFKRIIETELREAQL